MLQRKHKDIIPTYEQIVHQTFLLLHLYASGSFDSSKVMSYYNVCQHYFLQYMTLYVEGVGQVGTFLNVVEWISKAEYEKLERDLGLNNK